MSNPFQRCYLGELCILRCNTFDIHPSYLIQNNTGCAVCPMLRSQQKRCEYSKRFTRLTLCEFSLLSRFRGGGAYLCGFTPCKPLSFPPLIMEVITTISASYLLWSSHKRRLEAKETHFRAAEFASTAACRKCASLATTRVCTLTLRGIYSLKKRFWCERSLTQS